MSDKKIIMCGCHVGGYPTIRFLLEEGFRFASFVILSPKQAQKYKISGYQDFRSLAKHYDIPIYIPKTYSLTHPEDLAYFRQHHFDLLIQGGWQRLFPDEILTNLSIGAIGGHGSADFLPKGRGRSPLNWCLIEDHKRFIMHLFLMKPGIDDGDVFDWEVFDINKFDTIQTLYYKVSIVSKKMLKRSIPQLLDGTIKFFPQRGQPSYYEKRTPEDGHIDWESMDVWQIYNLIRAVTRPYPGARAEIEGTFYFLWRAQIFDARLTYPGKPYGEIVERFGNDLVVNCRGGLLLIQDYEQMEDD
jgi:methionyl-tRNA formyltransferase